MLRKIEDTRALLHSTGHDNVEIQVDGNVSFENIPAMVSTGATMLVGGSSSVFHKDYSIPEAIAAVREIVRCVEAAP
jgi:ribulose-phosphate 3-epimerase